MEVTIRPRSPFDFTKTARFLRRSEIEAVDTFEEGRYRRSFQFGNELLLLNVESRGTCSRPLLVARVEGSRTRSDLLQKASELVRHIFSTAHELQGFRACVADDSVMSEIEARYHGLQIARWPSLFEALTVSILLQQISTAVAMALKRRLVEAFGARLDLDDRTFYAFPLAERLAHATIEELRGLGISTSKASYIVELARRIEAGKLEKLSLEQEDNEGIIARLTGLRGIGRWTAEWCLVRYFGRTHVYPAGDLVLRNFIIRYYNKGKPLSEREVRAFAERQWGRWASYATVYCIAAIRDRMINPAAWPVLLSAKKVSVAAQRETGRPERSSSKQ